MDPYRQGNNGKVLQPEEREYSPGTLSAVRKVVRGYECFNKYEFENHYMYMRRIEELRDWATTAARELRRQWDGIVESRSRPSGCHCGGGNRNVGPYHLSPHTPSSSLPSYFTPSTDVPSSSRHPLPARRLQFEHLTPQPVVRAPTPTPPAPQVPVPEPEPAPEPAPVEEPGGIEEEDSDSEVLMWEDVPPSPEIINISSDEEEPMEEEDEEDQGEIDDAWDPDFDLDDYKEDTDSQDGQLP